LFKTSGLQGQEFTFAGLDSWEQPTVNPSDSTALFPKIKFCFWGYFFAIKHHNV